MQLFTDTDLVNNHLYSHLLYFSFDAYGLASLYVTPLRLRNMQRPLTSFSESVRDQDGRGNSPTPVGGAYDAVLSLDKDARSFSLSSVTWSAGGAGRSSFPWILCCSLFFNTQYTSPEIFSKMV